MFNKICIFKHLLLVYCSPETTGDESYKGEYNFPRTKLHHNFSLPCRYGNRAGYNSNIVRRCLLDHYGNAKWQMVDLSMCSAKSVFSNTLLDILDVSIIIY